MRRRRKPVSPRALLALLPLSACAASDRGAAAHAVPPASSSAIHVAAAPSTSASTGASESSSVPEPELPIAQITEAEGIGLAPGPTGHLGAWLALGPFRLDESPNAKAPPFELTTWHPVARDDKGKPDPGKPIEDRAFVPRFGAVVEGARVDVAKRDVGKDGKPYGKPKGWSAQPAQWSLVSSGDGPIDLDRAMYSNGKPAIGYLGGVLRVPRAMRLLLLVGSDDGCEVIVDGKSRFARDASRPQRDDDDLVPLDLDAGDHVVLFKLHQRDAGWSIRVRLVDRSFRPPQGVRLLLPGATHDSALALVRAMSWVRLSRVPKADGWSIETLVKYPEGAPLNVPLAVSGAVLDGDKELSAMHALGSVPIGPRAVSELAATIATLGADVEEPARTLSMRVDVGGRVVDGAIAPRKPVREAIARARALLAKWKPARPEAMRDDVEATLEHLSERLAQQVGHGDLDLVDQLADAKFLDAFVADAEAGNDPIAKRTGVMRLAHVARADDAPQPIVVHVPKGSGKKPLYVGLHGMNGGPMSMMRVFFGGDDEKKSMGELERSMAGQPPLDAFVIAPHAHGNAMYRQLGEEEVLDAIAWARARWPNIDPDRVYLTGFSMGGIGAASIPFHHPDVFAASQPLCGYHSYYVRRDVAGHPRRPWETFLVDDRSNVSWVDNGARLPLWIIHGTHDLPEENSGVLIDAYDKRGFSLKHDHPDLGHDVWGWAYDQMQHVAWFAGKKRVAHPHDIHFKTNRSRFGDDAWLHVDRMRGVAEWGTVDARIEGKSKVVVTTKGIDALHLDRDPALLGDAVTVVVDGTKLSFAAGDPLALHADGAIWLAGAPSDEGLHKQGKITGPIRDVWNEPLIVVYGASDPEQTQANLEVAQQLATIRWGVDVRYPIVRDLDVDPAATPSKSMILVGNARSNRIVRALEPELPLKTQLDGEKGSITFGGRTFTGDQLGAAFVYPHPRAPSRYVLVVEGVDALGTFRALSLPELLPDFVVYDEHLAPARGQTLLGFGSVLTAGYFDVHWKAPILGDDPLAQKPSFAKSEKDATPYLP